MKGIYLAPVFVSQNPKTLSLKTLPKQESTRAGFEKVCWGYQMGPTHWLQLRASWSLLSMSWTCHAGSMKDCIGS